MQMPRRTIPPIPGLIAFEATARLLSFSRAAEDLALTQGAVSKRVRQLEEQLGVALILRGAQHLQLTRAGEVYLPKVRDLLARMDQATRDLLAESGQPQELVVRCDEAFAIGWLVPRLAEFARLCPEAVVHLQTAPAAEDGYRPTDMRIRVAPESAATPDEAALFPCELGAVTGRQSAAGSSDAEVIARLPLLSGPGQGAAWQQWSDRQAQAGSPPAGPVCDRPSVLAALAANGHGIALLPRLLIQEDLRSGRLRRIGGWIAGPGSYLVSTPGTGCNPAAALRLRQWIEAATGAGRLPASAAV